MKIKINGRLREVSSSTLYSVAQELGCRTDGLVMIINGFQTNENVSVSSEDEIVLIEKGKMPDSDEFEAMLSARHTPKVYQKVKASRVAIAGLGGLGSNIALMLARTGVGTLHLIDFDTVEPSNLNRQQYMVSHLGMKKTDALKAEIAQINPYVCVICDCVRVTDENCAELFKDDRIVCEAFDKADAKALLVNNLLESRKDVYVVSASGMAGFERSNSIVTRKITDRLYLCGDGTSEARQGSGLMSPRVTICAAHQANAVLRIILNEYDV